MVEMTLSKYHGVVSALAPELKKLFYPHLSKIKAALEPGMAEFNWTSYHWQDFTEKLLLSIDKFGKVVKTANDIFESRVAHTLQSMTELELYELPRHEPWTLHHFLERAKARCVFAAKELQRKSLMVEEAIEDLIELASQANPKRKQEEEVEKDPYRDFLTVIDRSYTTSVSGAARDLRRNYSNIVSVKLINLTRTSLRVLARYFNIGEKGLKTVRVFVLDELVIEPGPTTFVLRSQLSIPSVEVVPSLEEVQNILSVVGKLIITVTKGVRQWGKTVQRSARVVDTEPEAAERAARLYNPVKIEQPLIEELTPSFYKVVSESKEVTKAFSQLTTSLANQKLELTSFKSNWDKYSEIWLNDREESVEQFLKEKPRLNDFEDVLYKFKLIKSQLSGEKDEEKVGRIVVCSRDFKRTLNDEIQQWINIYCNTLYTMYVNETKYLITQIEDMDKKLDRPIKDLDDIRIIMETQKKIRDIDIDMDIKIKLVENGFSLIEKYDLPVTSEHKKEVETLFVLWMALQTKSMDVQILLLAVQEHFQKNLNQELQLFQAE